MTPSRTRIFTALPNSLETPSNTAPHTNTVEGTRSILRSLKSATNPRSSAPRLLLTARVQVSIPARHRFVLDGTEVRA